MATDAANAAAPSPGPRSDAPAAFVRARDVRKAYRTGGREVHALRGASLEISEPGFYAIMGSSGSGKSTLLHLLAGLDRPDSGTIEVAGSRIDALDERGLTVHRRTRVGVVFQQYNLLPTLSAIDNVMLPGVLDGRPRAALRARAAELLATLGLADRADHRPEALSGGEQQRVAIARAFVTRPAVLFADEPTGNLDTTTGAKIADLLFDLNAHSHTTLVLVTHDRALAARCGRVWIMEAGRLGPG
jgi:putative ABC transport system ATP-binding protein